MFFYNEKERLGIRVQTISNETPYGVDELLGMMRAMADLCTATNKGFHSVAGDVIENVKRKQEKAKEKKYCPDCDVESNYADCSSCGDILEFTEFQYVKHSLLNTQKLHEISVQVNSELREANKELTMDLDHMKFVAESRLNNPKS